MRPPLGRNGDGHRAQAERPDPERKVEVRMPVPGEPRVERGLLEGLAPQREQIPLDRMDVRARIRSELPHIVGYEAPTPGDPDGRIAEDLDEGRDDVSVRLDREIGDDQDRS